MSHPLNILIIDDSEEAALREIEELKKAGYYPTYYRRVETREEMESALAEKNWEVVISDFHLPNFSGMEALKILREKGLDLPFTIVADTMNEEIALECLKAGVHGFFRKNYIRLLPAAVERGLYEATLKQEKKETEELFRNLAMNFPVGVYIVQKGRFVYTNSRFQEFSGYSEEELLGKEALTLVFPEDREKVRGNAISMLKGKRIIMPYEFRLISKSGEIKWALESVSSIQYRGKRATIGCYQDITERKWIEEQLQKSETRYRQLVETMSESLVVTDPDLKITYMNNQFSQLLGYSSFELIGHRLSEFIPDEFTELLEQQLAKRKRGINEPYELPLQQKSGNKVYTKVSPRGLFDENGNYLGSIGILTDITALKQTEDELKKNIEKYQLLSQEFQAILNAIPDNLSLISPELKIVWVNKAVEKSSGKNFSEIAGRYCYQIWHNRSEPCEVCAVQKSLISKKPDFQQITNRGKFFEIHTVPIINEKGEVRGVVELARDVTEKKQALEEMIKLQDQLRQAQKMEAIGRLAGGVAHDFNNLLTVIQGHTEISLNALRKDDPLRTRLEEIAQASARAANLTRQLLAFSRRQVLSFRVIDLNLLLADLEKMLGRIIGEEIELVTSFAEDLGTIKADPGA
ncbi:MAG: PAS domain S-box protein, partial [Desulfobacterota bacterium]|nr:PAS domain S-box protein [Thermodesulfobacteriota bacterium]